ncbi:hypothetical protein MMC07_005464 [Pseudocyphellaria aurata]|nr:hypothetical protein [Pseudocyphellaria aurata]
MSHVIERLKPKALRPAEEIFECLAKSFFEYNINNKQHKLYIQSRTYRNSHIQKKTSCFSIPYVAAERVIIGMYLTQSEWAYMILRETLPNSGKKIAAMDVSSIFFAPSEAKSCPLHGSHRHSSKAKDVKVLRILRDLPDAKKRAMGRFVEPKKMDVSMQGLNHLLLSHFRFRG